MPKFTRELEELHANGVITPEVAEKIRTYYDRPSPESNRMVIAFGIIGALLVGMGVVLIIAHNWDNLSTAMKLFVGFAPMLVAQAIAGWLIYKKSDSSAWREAVAVVLIFAVATSIAVVSPVYYWPLAIAALPFYFNLIRKHPNANSISFHNWIIGISVTIVLAMGDYHDGDDLIIPVYITLFSVFLLIGQLPYFASRRLITNAWLIGGSAGTIVLLLMMTFEWPDFSGKSREWWISTPLFLWIFLFVVASTLLYVVGNKNGFRNLLSKSYTFLILLGLFAIGLSEPLISRGLTNILILALGVYTIREGALADKLWKMNYGLLILSILIMCRFFDTDMSFVVRGLLFVGIGAGFFATNYYVMKKRRVAV